MPAVVASHFRVSDLREDNYAAGLSMGGYGALKLALRAPERFSAAAALSAVTDWPESLRTVVPGVMGNNYVCPPEDDLYHLADEGFSVVYRESAGGHSWEFWDEYIQYVLEWLCGA